MLARLLARDSRADALVALVGAVVALERLLALALGLLGRSLGEKRYAREGDARRYAAALDREDREDLGRRAPLVAGLPLRIARALRRSY